jgi:molecular chaperone GrpE
MSTKPPKKVDEDASEDGDAPSSGDAPASSEKPALDPLETALAEAARYKDSLLRTAADFDNFRKRTRREVDDARKAGREEFLKEILPVFDNLERGIQSSQRATEVKAVADGLLMVLKQFENTLARLQITRVPTVGVMFDPSIHEAIQQVETDEQPAGTVVAEVQPGYMNGERLMRAAMVVVAKPKSAERTEDDSETKS